MHYIANSFTQVLFQFSYLLLSSSLYLSIAVIHLSWFYVKARCTYISTKCNLVGPELMLFFTKDIQHVVTKVCSLRLYSKLPKLTGIFWKTLHSLTCWTFLHHVLCRLLVLQVVFTVFVFYATTAVIPILTCVAQRLFIVTYDLNSGFDKFLHSGAIKTYGYAL